MPHKRHKYDVIVLLAVVSLAFSLFLAISKALNITVPCDITQGCEVVLNSKYASIGGLPLSHLGVGFSSVIIILALLANHYIIGRKILTLVLGLGSLGALGFLGIQFLVLKNVCQYCLTVDVLTILMFIWDINIEHRGERV
jgi:uncharacterized membrane protein